MKDLLKQRWWIILVIGIFVLPVLLNFFVFKPTSKLSVGTLQDWMSFWGSYLGATIPAIVAFVILSIQRKDNKLENEKNRTAILMRDKTKRRCDYWDRSMNGEKDLTENEKEKQLDVFACEQKKKWLCELREVLTDYICAYRENDINNIVSCMYCSSYEYVQHKIEDLLDNVIKADTALELVILNHEEKDGVCSHKNGLNVYFNQYVSILKDLQILAHLYYNKIPYISGSLEIRQLNPSNDLVKHIQTIGKEDHPLNYDKIIEIAHRLITPIPETVKTVRALGFEFMQDESKRMICRCHN
jgi:hypothetical protein